MALSAVDLLARLLIASALGALVGVEREAASRGAGPRTHALVALGARCSPSPRSGWSRARLVLRAPSPGERASGALAGRASEGDAVVRCERPRLGCSGPAGVRAGIREPRGREECLIEVGEVAVPQWPALVLHGHHREHTAEGLMKARQRPMRSSARSRPATSPAEEHDRERGCEDRRGEHARSSPGR